MTRRETVEVGGVPISYLTAGQGGLLLLLLHGTYWSRVWQPVLEGIAAGGGGFPRLRALRRRAHRERGFGPTSLGLAGTFHRGARS
jgi:hypothetical protein